MRQFSSIKIYSVHRKKKVKQTFLDSCDFLFSCQGKTKKKEKNKKQNGSQGQGKFGNSSQVKVSKKKSNFTCSICSKSEKSSRVEKKKKWLKPNHLQLFIDAGLLVLLTLR